VDFWEVLEKRHCVRHFDSSRDVTDEEITKLLTAATRAPNAGNLQTWYFVVVRNKDARASLASAANGQKSLEQAPVAIVICADIEAASKYGQRGSSLYSIQDGAAAMENLMLAAVAMGLGTCWVGAFNEAAVSTSLQLSSNLRPVIMVPVGLPVGTEPPTSRRPLEELTQYIP
jgi:nitroreductase